MAVEVRCTTSACRSLGLYSAFQTMQVSEELMEPLAKHMGPRHRPSTWGHIIVRHMFFFNIIGVASFCGRASFSGAFPFFLVLSETRHTGRRPRQDKTDFKVKPQGGFRAGTSRCPPVGTWFPSRLSQPACTAVHIGGRPGTKGRIME